MGSSLFGGGTTKVNSSAFNDSNSNSTANASTNTNTNQNANSNTSFSNNGQNVGDTSQYQNQGTYGTSNPSEFQMPYINSGLGRASSLLNDSFATPQLSYTSLSPSQTSALDALSGYASGTGAPTMTNLMNTGYDMTGALGDARTSANGILSSTTSDPTQANIDAASAYADNPYTQGMIDKAQRPIERQLDEVAIPGLNGSASRSNNMDSSRAGAAEAILRRGAAEDEADISSDILGKQYTNGLNLAEQARGTNLNAGLNATGLLSGIGRAGSDMAIAGNNAALSDYNVPVQVGQAYQNDANMGNQVSYQNSQEAANFPWQQLGNYWNIAGRPLGTTTSSNGYLSGAGRTNQNQFNNGTQSQVGYGNTNSNTNGTQTSTGHNSGFTNSSGTQTNPGPGLLGGSLGLLSGVGSFFSPGGAWSSIRSLF